MTTFSDNALRLLQNRYLLRNGRGRLIETPDGMFQRVARSIAQAELTWGTEKQVDQYYQQFYDVMRRLEFLPNSPTLMNAGTPLNQLSACFVLPVNDHLEDIFDTLKKAALVQQSGGGTGFNFSHLRPKNDRVNSPTGLASGPVSFMKIFDAATEHIKQGGKRRGANMGILTIDHPDIEAFIHCKNESNTLQNFNISVGITDAFMEAVAANTDWKLHHPNTGKVTGHVKAQRLWKSIVENAWHHGDPGIIFLDTINTHNPTPALGTIEATNPCGEVPLLPYESCNLGSINLCKFITHKDTIYQSVDWNRLEHTVHTAVRMLDDIIEINNYLIPETKSISRGNRKIGLGVMGWAESLYMLEIPYESTPALKLAEMIMTFIAHKSMEASMHLAKERGPFLNWKKSIFFPHCFVRHATRTSIAPTGSISILADTSPSIEPFFALAFQRQHVLQDETLPEINRPFMAYLHKHKLDTTNLLDHVKAKGTLEKTNLSTHIKNIFKTALEIQPYWHLKHQMAFQKHTDNAVSKTINLSADATEEDVDIVYKAAWKLRAKGITVYRYDSKEKQVMHRGVLNAVKSCHVCME